MKALSLIILLCIYNCASAQHSIKKLWATDSVLATPESVLPDGSTLYVSLINGAPWGADGKGGVAKLTTNGGITDTAWITGLNAPKGMGRFGNKLYVADINEVVVIDVDKNAIDHKIKIDSAEGLNDISIHKSGVVFVTDSRKGKVFAVNGDKGTMLYEGLNGVNGIKVIDDDLYILTADAMYKATSKEGLTKICTLENGGDGIEPVGNGDFIVTAWVGYLYYVHADGTKDVLLDTHDTNNKTADIGYDAAQKIIYVPTFMGKSVVAYQLQ